jgi:Amt family ammonium transporter
MWVIVAACLVLFMQAGFAMLEVGFSRMKNVGSVVAKILVNLAIAALLFWAFGFALAFGAGNALVGTEGWFLAVPAGQVNDVYSGLSWTQVPLSAKFLFQVAFCAVSLAIVWGTMLERTKFAVYVVFAVVFAGLIYPMVGHWIWGGGWLTELGMQDFAGSTVVHLSGAMAALAGTLLLGPRLGKYDDDGRPVNIPGHNMPLAVLGVLILWIGWWGFNPGSTMAAIPDIADIALTTNLAAAAGVLGAMGIMYATLVYVDRIGVDDPLGAIAAHGMGGIWGTLSCGLFTTPALAAVGEPGLFYGGGFYQLGIQALGIVAAGGFVFLASLAVFATLKATIGIRVKPEQELDGLDIHEHGVFGYPDLVATDFQNGNGKISDPLESVPEGTA